jgi:hypothetical protein
MDLVELRVLAVGGILAVGVAASILGVAAQAATEWIGRMWQARAADPAGTPAVGQGSTFGAGRARC